MNDKKFSLVKRAKSFTHAGRGVWIFVKTTHNAWIQIFICCASVILGVYFNISHIEWILLTLASGLVFVAEAFNTAIEIDMDLTSPEYHPFAKDTKDVSAGAVLIAAIISGIVGLFVFLPYLF